MSRTTRQRPRPAIRRRRAAVWLKKNCDACGAPCRVAEEQLGTGRFRGALIDRDPADGALLVRNADGYLVRDYRHEVPGRRWAFHLCPVRNAGSGGGT